MSNALNVMKMKQNPLTLKGTDFIKVSDYSSETLTALLEQAYEMKRLQKEGIPHPYLSGKILGMVFEKSSTRTRVSFQVGMKQLGGDAIFLSKNDIQLGRGETISDTAKVLSRYVDGIMIRTFEHEKILELAEHADVPVINGLTDLHHPAQTLADLLTIYEHKGQFKGLKLCYVGDGNNNVCHSLIEGAVLVGMDVSVASPEGFEPNAEILGWAIQQAEVTGSSVTVTVSPEEAVKGADVIVTDVWTSMGQEEEKEARHQIFKPYQVNAELCGQADPDYIFLHCLPAHRGEEVTADIIDGPHSVVFDEAENRLHAQKAILKNLLGS
ncbi:ornithine carbamoyltransferase [Pullulanibacillus sp. KACC 23026]|uniref:ornithine carbamoyltransferase n=1 Tax=Pullulanibacillus sp. KACC 23026 TaxID=3028315 RepID=UPI0023AEEC83|nr:ornithine carbamoyltransferase [Pullulanibacillus sp. KACC 23026]WEG13069.1 ornithine carbamoyltransferase [Pullulanibacillus sp. KACC 23026]